MKRPVQPIKAASSVKMKTSSHTHNKTNTMHTVPHCILHIINILKIGLFHKKRCETCHWFQLNSLFCQLNNTHHEPLDVCKKWEIPWGKVYN